MRIILRFLHERLAIPDVWRGPSFALLVWRPWTAIGIGVAIVLSLALGGGGAETLAASAELYGVLLLVSALVGGSVGRDRSSARQFVLFQNPGSEVGHYLRLWLLAYGVAIGLTVVIAAAFALQPSSELRPIAFIAGAALFATMVFAAAVLSTTLFRAGDSAVVLMWTLAPIVITVLAQQYGLGPATVAILESPFVPFNAVFALQRAIAIDSWVDWRTHWSAQLLCFPLLCLMLAIRRLRSLSAKGAG